MRRVVTERAHPLVRRFYQILADEGINVSDIARTSGLSDQGIWDWKDKSNPSVPNFEAALNAAGYRLEIVEAG